MSLSPCLCVRTLLPSLPSLPMEGPVPRKEGTLTYTLLHTTCTTMHDTKLRVCAAAAAAAAAAMTLPFGILSCTVRRERERETAGAGGGGERQFRVGGRDLRVLELGREVGTRQAVLFASFSRNELRGKKKKGNCFHGARRVPFSPSTVTERGKILMGPKTSPLFLYNSSPLHPHCGSGAVPRGGNKKKGTIIYLMAAEGRMRGMQRAPPPSPFSSRHCNCAGGS